MACDIVEICKSSEIELKVEWKSRDDKEIRFYDGVSKDFDPSEYRISDRNFSFWKISSDLLMWTYLRQNGRVA